MRLASLQTLNYLNLGIENIIKLLVAMFLEQFYALSINPLY